MVGSAACRLARDHMAPMGEESVSHPIRVGSGQFLLKGVLTMKTDLTSNHLKIPGSLYAVVYMVLSIHIFYKRNTHDMVRSGRWQVVGMYNPSLCMEASNRTQGWPVSGARKVCAEGTSGVKFDFTAQYTSTCSHFLASIAHLFGIWQRKCSG
jgi:hypothetical protein